MIVYLPLCILATPLVLPLLINSTAQLLWPFNRARNYRLCVVIFLLYSISLLIFAIFCIRLYNCCTALSILENTGYFIYLKEKNTMKVWRKF